MTSKTHNFIELGDLLAFHLECEDCHSSINIPLATLKADSIPYRCPHCSENWGKQTNQRPTWDYIKELARSLDRLSSEIKDPAEVGFTFSLEVSGPFRDDPA